MVIHSMTVRLLACLTVILLAVGCGIPGLSSKKEMGLNEGPISPGSLVGKYYNGDGLGVVITLTLKKDSTFNVVSEDCLGKYDDGSGKWRIADTLLILTPSSENGMLLNPLRTLLIQQYKNCWIFVRMEKSAQDHYHKFGGSRLACFLPRPLYRLAGACISLTDTVVLPFKPDFRPFALGLPCPACCFIDSALNTR
jgi:hypothetical protein